MNINYDLIGSMPELDSEVQKLPFLIAAFQSAPKTNKLDVLSMSPAQVGTHVDKAFKDPAKLEKMANGALIEMLAGHMYGLDAQEYDSIDQLIGAIKSMEQYVTFH